LLHGETLIGTSVTLVQGVEKGQRRGEHLNTSTAGPVYCEA